MMMFLKGKQSLLLHFHTSKFPRDFFQDLNWLLVLILKKTKCLLLWKWVKCKIMQIVIKPSNQSTNWDCKYFSWKSEIDIDVKNWNNCYHFLNFTNDEIFIHPEIRKLSRNNTILPLEVTEQETLVWKLLRLLISWLRQSFFWRNEKEIARNIEPIILARLKCLCRKVPSTFFHVLI